MLKQLTREETKIDSCPPESITIMERWIARGDGVAVYQHAELGNPECGDLRYLSYGSPAAQIESDDVPERMPDIGSQINWRFYLLGVYGREGC